MTSANCKASAERLVLIDRLVLNPEFQVRVKLDEHAIRRYAALYVADRRLDPIRVADVDGVLIVVDGWHRLEALKLSHASHAQAVVTAMTRDEAKWEAATANAAHGVQLKRADLVNVFKLYVRSGRHVRKKGEAGRILSYKSYREMANELPFPRSHGTIRNWMFKYFPGVAYKIGADDVPLAPGGLREAGVGLPTPTKAEKLAGELLSHFTSLSSASERDEAVSTVRELLARLEVAAGLRDEPEPEF